MAAARASTAEVSIRNAGSPPSCLLAVSPHLDDVAFGCGQLIAEANGSVVVTVFTGTPDHGEPSTWDRRLGFRDAASAMAQRLAEDDVAMERLGARPVRLGFLDHAYRRTAHPAPTVHDIADRIAALSRDIAPRDVAVPLGLGHPDHVVTARACRVALRQSAVRCVVYAEQPYDARRELVARACREWRADGFRLSPLPSRDAGLRKGQAAAAYSSQLVLLVPAGLDVVAADRLWLAEPVRGAHPTQPVEES
jgi:LmbE family N-acetylglucosaminyl deacetylase